MKILSVYGVVLIQCNTIINYVQNTFDRLASLTLAACYLVISLISWRIVQARGSVCGLRGDARDSEQMSCQEVQSVGSVGDKCVQAS